MQSVTLKLTLQSFSSQGIRAQWTRLQASPLRYRFAHGVFWSLFAALSSRGLGVVASIFAARMLGKQGFGELGMIHSTVGLFAVFATASMGTTAARYVAEYRVKDTARAGRLIALCRLVAWLTGSIMASILVVFAPWLAEHTLAAPHLSTSIRLAALVLLFGAVSATQSGVLNGLEAFKTNSLVDMACGVAAFPITIVCVWFFGLTGAVAALVVYQALNAFLNSVSLRVEAQKAGIPLGWRGARQEMDVLWRFNLPALLSTTMVGPVIWVTNAI